MAACQHYRVWKGVGGLARLILSVEGDQYIFAIKLADAADASKSAFECIILNTYRVKNRPRVQILGYKEFQRLTPWLPAQRVNPGFTNPYNKLCAYRSFSLPKIPARLGRKGVNLISGAVV